MGLLSFFKREKGVPAEAARPGDAGDAVQAARTRARQRLIGAVLLVGLGIIGFPLLFETQPRPIPVDLPIEIPRKDAVPPLVMPPPRTAASAAVVAASAPAPAPAVITETRADADAGREVPAPAASAAAAAPARADKAAEKGTEKAAEKPPAAPAPAATKDEAAARFIVQVGAFAAPASAREARLKVEKLGLKTYTQEVQTQGGKRIRVRVGPFASRAEADKAAARLKAAGLPAALLAL